MFATRPGVQDFQPGFRPSVDPPIPALLFFRHLGLSIWTPRLSPAQTRGLSVDDALKDGSPPGSPRLPPPSPAGGLDLPKRPRPTRRCGGRGERCNSKVALAFRTASVVLTPLPGTRPAASHQVASEDGGVSPHAAHTGHPPPDEMRTRVDPGWFECAGGEGRQSPRPSLGALACLQCAATARDLPEGRIGGAPGGFRPLAERRAQPSPASHATPALPTTDGPNPPALRPQSPSPLPPCGATSWR